MNAQSRTILVIDDNMMNRELASFLLEHAGFEVRCAEDGSTGLEMIATSRPDLVLMDIQLPGMNGLEVTRLLKADPVTQHIPVVAFTAYAMKGDEEKMRGAGCDGYLSKPIDGATFADQVSTFLRPKSASPGAA